MKRIVIQISIYTHLLKRCPRQASFEFVGIFSLGIALTFLFSSFESASLALLRLDSIVGRIAFCSQCTNESLLYERSMWTSMTHSNDCSNFLIIRDFLDRNRRHIERPGRSPFEYQEQNPKVLSPALKRIGPRLVIILRPSGL
jgi:hypothetical protein